MVVGRKMKYTFIEGSVTAAKGFKASGVHCGIRKNKSKRDLGLIYCEKKCTAAAVYTKNLVQSSPITICKQNLADGFAQAVIVNSGNANTCNADGPEIARKMCGLAAQALGLDPTDIIIGSTGVIGQPLSIIPIENGMAELVNRLNFLHLPASLYKECQVACQGCAVTAHIDDAVRRD